MEHRYREPTSSEPPEVDGVVTERMPQGLYRVKCSDGEVVIASLAEKSRQTMVGLVPGERVVISLSPFDRRRGRILCRQDGT